MASPTKTISWELEVAESEDPVIPSMVFKTLESFKNYLAKQEYNIDSQKVDPQQDTHTHHTHTQNQHQNQLQDQLQDQLQYQLQDQLQD